MFESQDSRVKLNRHKRPDLTVPSSTKKPVNTGITGCFLQLFQVESGSLTPVQVEPPGVEPGSKQATHAAFSMLSPRLVFDQGLTVDGPPLT